MKKILAYFLLVLITMTLFGCQADERKGDISVQDAWIRVLGNVQSMEHSTDMQQTTPEASPEMTTAAFVTISNAGTENDRLLRAEFELAQAVELHLSEMKDGVMSMRPVDGIDIPAGSTVELKPGGYHIMLINLKQGLIPTEKYPLTLVFEKAGSLTIDADALLP